MAVKAPFRFARINRWIHEPAWGPLVSHDVPFADGLSGRATVRITAKTPLLVGGRRRPASETRAGAVWPFRLPDGGWAIPPATLQGMCRSILEVAAFGRLGPWIEDRRFGIRDLTASATAHRHYRDFLSGARAGWLIRVEGAPRIVPCRFARLRHSTLQRMTGCDFGDDSVTLEDRYKAVKTWEKQAPGGPRFRLRPGQRHMIAEPDATGEPGSIVVTGHVSRKKAEFLFHTPTRQGVGADDQALTVADAVWETFLYLHCDSHGKPKHPAWRYWASEYEAGHGVPVFWWPDPADDTSVATFGMAFAFKAGFLLSTHDLLAHSAPGHTAPLAEAALDLPHLIFGAVAEADGGQGLKRRAWFGIARTVAGPQDSLHRFARPAILSNPKPGYLGLYVRQRPAPDNIIPQDKDRGDPLAAYASVDVVPKTVHAADRERAADTLCRPEIAGVKLWPSSRDRDRGIRIPDPPKVAGAQPPGPLVQTELSAVPAGAVFETTLTFHNLRPVELGAVLWALSFGDPGAFGGAGSSPRLRHRLGMGKPFGLGEVEIDIPRLALDDGATLGHEELLSAFTAHMEAAYPRPNAWARSPQVLALRKAADPDANRAADLRYMDVTGPAGHLENRKRGAFLGPYVDEAGELSKPAAPEQSGDAHKQGQEPAELNLMFREGEWVVVYDEEAKICKDVSANAANEERVTVRFCFDDKTQDVPIHDIKRRDK